MSTEKLRLEADMRDNASPVVRKLKKELDTIRQTPGMAEATKWFGQFEEGAKGFVKSGGDAAGVVNALGIGGLSAAASVATLITQFKELGERTLVMKELGRQTGLTVDQINAFEHAGQSFGVGADVMRGALNRLASQMPEFRRNMGPLYGMLSGVKGAGGLIDQLKKDSPEKQIEDIFKFVGQSKLQNEPQLQKQILGAFFGSGDQLEALFARGATGFLDELKKQQASLGPITDDLLKQAQAYRDATIDFNTALTNFETGAGPRFLETMTALLKDAKDFVDVLGKGGNDKGADKSPDHQDHRSWGQAIGDAANDAGKALGKAWDYFSEVTKDKKPNPLLHKSAFDGSGGLLHRASFLADAPASAPDSVVVGMIADGTKIGFLAAMRELMATKDLDMSDGAPGFTNASYETGGGGGGGRGGGGGGAGGGFDGPVPLGSKAGSLTRLIDEEARRAGVDPRIMEGIRAGESLHGNRYDKKDDALESSWGPFQLNRRRGLGVNFEHDTGLDLRNPSTIAAQARWVAQYLARGGSLGAWAGFHGPRDANPRWGESGYVPNPQAGEGSGPAGSGFALGQLRSLHVLNEQCVSLAKAAVGASGSVREWRRGVGALEGTLKPGTPVATFLDSFGRQSRRYAGGGLGTMGAHLDHAGVFQSYIKDAAGKIVGMNMAEQYKGSHGVHSRAYMFGQGWGERNASNYHAVLGANGSFLGGANNPMNRRATGLAEGGHGGAGGRDSRHQVDIHLHDRGGNVRSTSHRGEGPMEVKLRTWPTMTEPSWET